MVGTAWCSAMAEGRVRGLAEAPVGAPVYGSVGAPVDGSVDGMEPRRWPTAVAVCMKWVALRPDVDPLTGSVETDNRWSGASAADEAALETALRIAAACEATVTVCTVGSSDAEPMLRNAVAAGASRAVRVDSAIDATSRSVAEALSETLSGHDLILCGDWSVDRGSGSVPVFLAAALGFDDACGLTSVDVKTRRLTVTRRLDGGRRERLTIHGPAVLSVEGSVARLRRASIQGVLAAASVDVEVRVATTPSDREPTPRRSAAFRPRPIDNPAPSADDPRDRVIQLTGAMSNRTHPQRLVLDADEAAIKILDQLADWGYDLPETQTTP